MVYVLNKNGKPLMPTDRYGHIRWLIKNKKAVPVCNNPFTIKLKYDTLNIIQSLTLGIDVGRENIGLGISNNKGDCLFLANVQTNNKQVTKNMQKRKNYRQERRKHKRQRKQRIALKLKQDIRNGTDTVLRSKKCCKEISISYPGMESSIIHKVIKGKEAKFNNRTRVEGWVTPSARNLIEIHINLVKKISKFLPLTDLVIENNIFDFQKLENSDIKNWEYNKGLLYGFKNYKDYIFKQQNGKCLLCNNEIKHYHHIFYKSKNGSNVTQNFAGLCHDCHTLVHNDISYEQILLKEKQGIKKKHQIGLLNSCMNYIIEELSYLYPTKICFGFDTNKIREKFNLVKNHDIDGFCISLFQKNINSVNIRSKTYHIKHFKKKSNNIIKRLGLRKYYLQNKLIAINRHKDFNQKEDSLEEFLKYFSTTHSQGEIKQLFHKLLVKPAKRVYTYHKNNFISPFKCGDVVCYSKKTNSGIIDEFIFFCTSVKIRNNSNNVLVDTNGREYNIKYCFLKNSDSLVFVG